MAIKVIMDVDTGSDDAVAIMTAATSPDIDLVAICTVWGNKPVENTTDNTLRLIDALGLKVPVYKGCDTAMVKYLTNDFVPPPERPPVMYNGYFIEKDATFSIDEFMADLERFYQAMRMQFAFEQMCLGNDEPALALHEDGRYFAGLPFFEQYRYDPENAPKIDYAPAKGDLLKEMQLDAESQEDIEVAEEGIDEDARFVRPVFDDYEKLQEKLVDMIPDFRIRLKVNPKSRKLVFAADVHSVFDICWYTLARKLSEDVTPEDKGTGKDTKAPCEGVVLSCPYCGEAFVRRSNRAVTCGREECKRARKRKNKQNSRKKQKIAKMQGE